VVDRELLNQYGDGLVVLSSSIRGEIGYHLLNGNEDEASKSIEWFKARFKDDFYLEVVDNGIPEQESVNQRLAELGPRLGVELVGTSESFYLDPAHAEAQEVLQCIPLGRTLDFERPKSLVPAEFSFKSASQMKARLESYPGAYENALKIADKCDLKFKFKDEQGKAIYHLPSFRPEGVNRGDSFDAVAFFKDQSREGLELRFQEPEFSGPEGKKNQAGWEALEKEYRTRLEEELMMIERTGFSGYFLIVSDFIKWAKSQNIPVGPGRGSGAGSLVAYALFITDIDPIEFEKTSMAEISMPKEIVLRHRPTAFGHIFSGDGYSAGYYVYIWADSMTADVYEGFMEKGGLYNKDACKLLETSIMSVGNSIPPDEAFRRFRGRDVDTNALMRDRGFPVT
jgi:DNA polymerase-3 subunit alpha